MAKNNAKRKDRQPKGGKQNLWETLGMERAGFIIGLFVSFVSVITVIAMVSYMFTAPEDQSLLEYPKSGEWKGDGQPFANYCSAMGAIVSHWLVARGFGYTALLIPLFTLLAGLKIMKAYSVNLWKWFLGMAVLMVWGSVVLSKFLTPFMEEAVFNPGGDHGAFCVQTVENMLGAPGLIALLVFILIAFLSFVSSETITMVRKATNPVKYLTNKVKLTVTNHTEETPEDTPYTAAEEGNGAENGKKEDLGEEATPVVVDLTDFKLPEGSKAVAQPAPQPMRGGAAEKTGAGLTVEIPKGEKKAEGRELTVEERLSTPINPREPFTSYKFPTLDLLKKYGDGGVPQVDMDEIKANNQRIVEVLGSFGVSIREIKATVGPTITLYEITPSEGVRINKIRNLEDDIALSLAALGIRIIAPIPGKGTIGIEVPNKKPNIVSMESILNSKKFQDTPMELPIALGKTITNEVFMVDLAKIPHLLVAGATGQGKSVGLNAIITSLLYKKHPNEMKLVLVDPKKVEFSIYSPLAKHFMATLPENDEEPIITDVTKVVRTLNSLCKLMDSRYDLLKIAGARNIKEYNSKFVNHKLDLTKGHDYMPYIVVVIDEFGDLIMTAGKEIELPIARIAQLARAVGIHMVIATQRPTTTIITGNIKANFPGRMAFKVSAQIDSRTIIDRSGANQLVGRGDMLFINGNDPVRVQCAFVDTPEIDAVNKHISSQPGPVEPMELPEPSDEAQGGIGIPGGNMQSEDPLFEDVARAVVRTGNGSTSSIQRQFAIGYNRAGKLVDMLEKVGIVGAAQGSKPRDVLIQDESSLNTLLFQLRNQ